MVFTTTNLFKGIACPQGNACRLTSCIFAHDSTPMSGEAQAAHQSLSTPEEPATKRRKITHDDKSGRHVSKSDEIREQLASERKGAAGTVFTSTAPPSLRKPVSPPPTNGVKQQTKDTSTLPNSANGHSNHETTITTQQQPRNDSGPQERLNPRLIPNDPAGHQKRMLYLKHMHSEMTRHNKAVSEAKDLKDKHLLVLTEQELTKMALDEEENLACTQGKLYGNKAKQRFATYKKMGLEEWLSHVKITVIEPRKADGASVDRDVKVIETGLSPDEEALVLPHLVADQGPLAKHGYIPTPPTEAQIAEARAGIESSKNYEQCDRCGSRFQVFPERNEQGLLTSHGPCKFHPNRKVFPQKTKNDYNAAAKEPYYPCCNEVVGSEGCTTHENHVFKSSAPGRLAAVLPFIVTPTNPDPAKDANGKEVQAVTFDCEMGYTTSGLELIRLTAVSWPNGTELVDVLVRPEGTIIDLNSRFSGVFPEHFANAIPYDEWKVAPRSLLSTEDKANAPPTILPVVASISDARALLCSYLTPTTPLIGHAIDNDLNTTRLCHPTIIDTVLLFPHPRGLPYRLGLKALTTQHLGRKIQQGGDRGHDSLEDARATGDLVRVKVRDRWGVLKRGGWIVSEDGKLVAPEGWVEKAEGPKRGQKRAREKVVIEEGGGEKKGLAAYLSEEFLEK